MALVRNATKHGVALTRGYLAAGEERNIDASPAWELQLLADGTLVMVDENQPPPAPPDHFDPVENKRGTSALYNRQGETRTALAISSGGVNRGPWQANTAYKQNDIVTRNGVTYGALADFTSGASFNAANWLVLGGSGSGLPSTVVAKTAAYTAAAGEFVEANAASAGFTVTLPSNPSTGALVAVKKVDATSNTVTVAPAGGGSIDGDTTATTQTKMAGAIFEHVGSNVWHIAASMATTGPAGTNGTNGTNGVNAALSIVQDEGSTVTQRDTMNFVGAGVSVADSGAKTTVTIPGGSASGLAYPSGRYAAMPGTLTTFSPGLGGVMLCPFSVPVSTTVDQMLVEVTTASGAACTARLAVYADSNGLPGSLVFEATTAAQIDVTTTGVKAATVSPSQTLAPGIYWLAFVQQGSGGAQIRGTNGGIFSVSSTSTAGAFSNSCAGVSPAGALASGAFPATLTGPFGQQVTGPRLGFRVA